MKFLWLAGLLAISYGPSVFADNSDKVELVNSRILLLNSEYFDPKSMISKVVPKCDSQNCLHFAFTIIKTLPVDTQNVYDIYRSDPGCSKYERIGGFKNPLCGHEKNKYDKYLSEELLKLKRSPKCGLPLHYDNECAGTLKVWNLLTEQQLANRCFYVINTVTANDGILFKHRLEFMSTLKEDSY